MTTHIQLIEKMLLKNDSNYDDLLPLLLYSKRSLQEQMVQKHETIMRSIVGSVNNPNSQSIKPFFEDDLFQMEAMRKEILVLNLFIVHVVTRIIIQWHFCSNQNSKCYFDLLETINTMLNKYNNGWCPTCSIYENYELIWDIASKDNKAAKKEIRYLYSKKGDISEQIENLQDDEISAYEFIKNEEIEKYIHKLIIAAFNNYNLPLEGVDLELLLEKTVEEVVKDKFSDLTASQRRYRLRKIRKVIAAILENKGISKIKSEKRGGKRDSYFISLHNNIDFRKWYFQIRKYAKYHKKQYGKVNKIFLSRNELRILIFLGKYLKQETIPQHQRIIKKKELFQLIKNNGYSTKYGAEKIANRIFQQLRIFKLPGCEIKPIYKKKNG